MKKLGIVIVNHDTRAYLRECLASVRAATRALSSEIIVVDNASSDGSVAMVSQEFPEVRLVRNEANLGFAAANNIAVRRFLESGDCEYLLLLNSDVVLSPTDLERLAGHLDKRLSVSAASPALVLPDGRFQTGVGGRLPSAFSGACYFFFLNKLLPRLRLGFYFDQPALVRTYRRADAGIPADWLSGACLILRPDVFRMVGLFDERYFVYGEDADLGRRMCRAGLRLSYLPEIRVLHRRGGSAPKSAANVRWLRMLYVDVRKERGAGEYFLFRGFSIAGFSLRLLGYSAARIFGCGPGREKIREIAGFLRFSLSGRLGPQRLPHRLEGLSGPPLPR